MTEQTSIESIFLKSLEFEDPSQRAAYLDAACGGNRQLRGEVERLLGSHRVAGSFLEGDAPQLQATEFQCVASRNESVLHLIEDAIGTAPCISLRDDEQPEPAQRIASREIPKSAGDGRYQLQGEIARGGMGAVIKGRDTDLGRDLAIKVLLETHKNRPEVVQRFVEEAQIGGQLQHPGIAPVYELGQFEDQRPFFTMKLVKGKTLAALLAERDACDADRSKFVGIFEQICQTMAYAHSRGVIHRDLKPANIMVGAFGEVQVMDWGLAKVFKAGEASDEVRGKLSASQDVVETLRSSASDTPVTNGSQTQMGSVMGTPAYMPPEQALGKVHQLDERTDVFGLGAILCEILTGQPPYVAGDTLKLFQMAKSGELDECISRLDESGADEELTAIARRCLSCQPEGRPLHAGKLTEHITDHLEAMETRLHESEIDLAAQEARVAEEQKRRKITLLLSSAIVFLVAALGGGGAWLYKQETLAAEALMREEANRADAERTAKERVQAVLYGAQVGMASSAISAGEMQAAAQILDSLKPAEGPDLRGFEWHMLRRQCLMPVESGSLNWSKSNGKLSETRSAAQFWHALSGDRNRCANLVTDKAGDTWLVVRDLNSSEAAQQVRVEHKDTRFWRVVLDQRGHLAALLGGGNEPDAARHTLLQIVNVDSGEVVCNIPLEESDSVEQAYFAFSRDSNSLAIAEQRSPEAVGESIDAEAFIKLSVVELPGDETRWSETLDGASRLRGPPVFSPDGMALAVCIGNQWEGTAISLLHPDSGEEAQRLRLPEHSDVSEAAFSPDGKRVAALVADYSFSQPGQPTSALNRFCVWDVDSSDLVTVSNVANGKTELVFSHDGSMVLVAHPNSPRAKLLDVESGRLVAQLNTHAGQLTRFADDDSFVEFIDRRGKRARTEIPRNPFRGGNMQGKDGTGPCCMSGDASRLARLHKLTLDVFDSEGAVIQSVQLKAETDARLFRRQLPLQCVVLNESGTLLTFLEGGREEAGQIVTMPVDRPDNRRQLYQCSEDEKLLSLFGSQRGSKVAAIFFDESDDSEESQLPGFRIWSGLRGQRNMKVWETMSGNEYELPELGQPYAAAFSKDGELLAVATLDSEEEATKIILVRLSDGSIVNNIDVGEQFISNMEFGQDDRLLACVSATERCIELWNLDTKEVQVLGEGTADDDLTLAFNSDGTRLFALEPGRSGRNLRIWSTVTGQLVMHEHYAGASNAMLMHLRFLPEQSKLVGWGYAGPTQTWNGRPVKVGSE